MTRQNQRCAAPGCTRWAIRGQIYCTRDLEHPPELDAAAWTSGELSAEIARKVQTAGADIDLSGELGAIRIALARVLTDVDDPVIAAKMVAELAKAAAGVARAKRTINGQQADAISEAFTQILLELDQSGAQA